jgi:hypothetical protein
VYIFLYVIRPMIYYFNIVYIFSTPSAIECVGRKDSTSNLTHFLLVMKIISFIFNNLFKRHEISSLIGPIRLENSFNMFCFLLYICLRMCV